MRFFGWMILLGVACVLAMRAPSLAADGDAALCHAATRQAERQFGVPDQLLTAISRVESGRPDAATGRAQAWPWSINVEGVGHIYDSREEVVAAVRRYEAAGARSIDVGCMQINLKQHPDAFASLEDAFDPAMNADFAAQFLVRLFQQTGSWPHAAAAYHSETPQLGRDYQVQVLAKWAEGDGPVPASGGAERPASRHSRRTLIADAAGSGAGAGADGGAGAGAGVDAMQAAGAREAGAILLRRGGISPIFAAQPVSGAPFGAVRTAFAIRDPRPVASPSRSGGARGLPPGTGRGLAAYRAMPIALIAGRQAHRL